MIPRIIRQGVKKLLPGHLPDFLIVGVQKAATTSLYYYLDQHPLILGSRPKEVCYFDRDANFEKGLPWYKQHFPNTRSPFTTYKYFEATPEYVYRSYVAKRIFEFNPNTKIIIVLREPVSRAFSAWSMYQNFKKRSSLPEAITKGYLKESDNNLFKEFYSVSQFPSFDEVINEDIRKSNVAEVVEEPSIVRRGIYYPQVKQYFDLFGKDNVLVLGFNDLVGENKVKTLNLILNFINLPSSDWKFLKNESKNIGRNSEGISILAKEKLQSFYDKHNADLFELLGSKPNW
jgi:hypothetical protein